MVNFNKFIIYLVKNLTFIHPVYKMVVKISIKLH